MKKLSKQRGQDHSLKKHIKEAVRFLKKIKLLKLDSKTDLYSLPWYLLIGPKNAGKTTLLTNAELKFILEKKSKNKNITPTTNKYDWWSTKRAVVIDTPGKYFTSSGQQNKNAPQKIFLKLLKKYRRKKHLQGVVIVLNVDEIISGSKLAKRKLYNTILEQVENLTALFHTDMPVFLVFNKCDFVTGFREFFGDLGKDERQQIWGISLQEKKNNYNIADNFDEEFNKLIRRLNDQLIWRLQHEHNADKRALINEFPLQALRLRPHLNQLLDNTFRSLETTPKLDGIFFTAATQQACFTHKDQEPISSSNRSLINMQQPKNKACFAHNLFESYIFAKPFHGKLPRRFSFFTSSWLRTTLCAGSIFLIVSCAFIWTLQFKQQIETINSAQHILTSYQTLNQNKPAKISSLIDKLKTLDVLQQASLAFKEIPMKFSLIFDKKEPSLKQKMSAEYKQSLRNFLLPIITTGLTTTLTNKSTPPDLLYASLKSYMMLGNSEKYNPAYIKECLQKTWGDRYSNNDQVKLLSYLEVFLKNFSSPISLNDKPINFARKRLLKMKPGALAYIILQNDAPSTQRLSLNLAANKDASSILTFVKSNLNIPSIYTSEYFSAIYPKLIEKATKEAISGNWVTGPIEQTKIVDLNKLTKKISRQYLTNYANTWLEFLNNIKIINFTTLPQLVNALKLLGSNHSPLTQLIRLAQNNIVPQVAKTNKTLFAFTKLNGLDFLQQRSSAPNFATGVSSITATLNDLYHYLNPAASAKNNGRTAFELASLRIRDNGQNDPLEQLLSTSQLYHEPVKSWLYGLGMNTWHLMLYQAGNYINTIWQKNITPQYQAQIENRFPFSQTSNNNVSLENFRHFFAPDGILDNFFSRYLSPFVDSTQIPWKLKNLDGDSLPIFNTSLASLQKAHQIQHVYFYGMDRHLFVPFSLQPNKIGNNVATIKVELGNQKTTYKNNAPFLASHFVWPDDANSNLTKITFMDKNKKDLSLVEHGPWGWLKLLQSGNIKPTNNPKQYMVTFNKKGLTANMLLTLNEKKNPFFLKQFDDFQLPEHL